MDLIQVYFKNRWLSRFWFKYIAPSLMFSTITNTGEITPFLNCIIHSWSSTQPQRGKALGHRPYAEWSKPGTKGQTADDPICTRTQSGHVRRGRKWRGGCQALRGREEHLFGAHRFSFARRREFWGWMRVTAEEQCECTSREGTAPLRWLRNSRTSNQAPGPRQRGALSREGRVARPGRWPCLCVLVGLV